MTRQNITGPTGDTDEAGQAVHGLIGWFDTDKALYWPEATTWDGQNNISVPTGILWDHQTLYLTAGGRWVLTRWSRRQDTEPTYEFIDPDQARDWLLLCQHDEAVSLHFGGIEGEKGPGRPEVGGIITARLGNLIAELDAYADERKISRSAAVRQLVEAGLSATLAVSND